MRKMLMLGTGALMLGMAGLAVAQPAPPPGGQPPAPPGQAQAQPPAPPGPAGAEADRPGPRGPMWMRHHGMMPPPPPPPSRAASFRLERGDVSISVRCAESEPMQACVNAANALLDKMNAVSR